jgi:hypothetical protein
MHFLVSRRFGFATLLSALLALTARGTSPVDSEQSGHVAGAQSDEAAESSKQQMIIPRRFRTLTMVR